ncbi:MAG: ASPIC/UnbV domain-containing protein, partial [Calditrichaeota bacterium]|nr:ASPIC/UnbV domain-containing protein [Calditrichota bacterium]
SKTGFKSQNSLVAHFGLNKAEIIDSLIIYWPSGIRWDTTNVAVNQKLTIWEKEKKPVSLNEEIIEIPDKYSLMQNYPNPFNPITTIKFGIPKKSFVKIELFNILGQKIKTLLNKNMEAGYHKVKFNAQDYSSGLYFYQMRSESFSKVYKMLLVK